MQWPLLLLLEKTIVLQVVEWVLIFLTCVLAVAVLLVLARYKRCPPDRILVIYGKVGKGEKGLIRSARCLHGSAALIWPVIRDYEFLDLTPITMDIDLRSALSKENIRINVPATFTVGISTEMGVMENAAERLLGLSEDRIRAVAEDIIFGQTRVVIATMEIQEIISNRDKFVDNITSGVEVELKKIGLKLINVNVKDIIDESGYIEALGKEAAARAINEAKKAVAEQDRDGESGKAEAHKDQRIKVSAANAAAVDGENTARINVANSNANRREKEAEAERRGAAAEKVQLAKALEESYKAEQQAEVQRAERERATQSANVVVPAEIEKKKVEIDAEAVAERYRREAQGEADSIYAKLEAQARGNQEVLVKQAVGLKEIVGSVGGDPKLAALLMITQKLPELVATQVEAVKNLKIDHVTVWDSAGSGGDNTPTTARFVAGLLKSLPPLQDLFEMAGLKLPAMLNVTEDAEKTEPEGEESDAMKKSKAPKSRKK